MEMDAPWPHRVRLPDLGGLNPPLWAQGPTGWDPLSVRAQICRQLPVLQKLGQDNRGGLLQGASPRFPPHGLGLHDLQSRHRPFKFVRNDADMVILPGSAVEEIRALPREVANPTVAHAHNLLGNFTRMDLILRSDLHFRMIQTKVTPNLGALSGPMEDEVKWAMHAFPKCKDEWAVIKPYHTILELVASTSARIFVGLPLCRNKRWLEASVQFTENSKSFPRARVEFMRLTACVRLSLCYGGHYAPLPNMDAQLAGLAAAVQLPKRGIHPGGAEALRPRDRKTPSAHG
jgi:hypothetical protein